MRLLGGVQELRPLLWGPTHLDVAILLEDGAHRQHLASRSNTLDRVNVPAVCDTAARLSYHETKSLPRIGHGLIQDLDELRHVLPSLLIRGRNQDRAKSRFTILLQRQNLCYDRLS